MISLTGCNFWQTKQMARPESPLVDLVESTHIIRTLMCQNRLSAVLEAHDPEQLTLLLDNVSPAKMAFESEVLACTIPLIVVYYFKHDTRSQDYIKQLAMLSAKYKDKIKFVVIDIEKLFSLAQDADIAQVPTILLVKHRDIVERLESDMNIAQLEQAIYRK